MCVPRGPGPPDHKPPRTPRLEDGVGGLEEEGGVDALRGGRPAAPHAAGARPPAMAPDGMSPGGLGGGSMWSSKCDERWMRRRGGELAVFGGSFARVTEPA